jgi:hypothetical protein
LYRLVAGYSDLKKHSFKHSFITVSDAPCARSCLALRP